MLKGETSVAEAAQMYGLTVAEVEEWREKFVLGAENFPADLHEGRRGVEGRTGQEVETEDRRFPTR
jgi:hypothetical protein